jgi:hypothetical protein
MKSLVSRFLYFYREILLKRIFSNKGDPKGAFGILNLRKSTKSLAVVKLKIQAMDIPTLVFCTWVPSLCIDSNPYLSVGLQMIYHFLTSLSFLEVTDLDSDS